jgi:hypothetical protein
MNAAIDGLHGSLEDREKSGRLALETNWRANPVQNGRSFALGLSLQSQRNRVTVNAGDKFEGEIDDNLQSRKRILEVSCTFIAEG